MLRVLSQGMGGNLKISEFLRPICQELGMEFITMSEWPEHDVKWTLGTWLEEIERADIVVCVARHDIQPGKSANRAVQAMSLGKPVLASPLPAYRDVINQGHTGFICDTPDEWRAALRWLTDEKVRIKMGKLAQASVISYAPSSIMNEWASLFKYHARENCRPPKVDIVIATYQNLKYLQLCVESIRATTDWPHNIIVSASGNSDGSFDWIQKQPDVIHHLSRERMHFSKANNEGIKIGKEPYVCLLNDDTIVSKGWLTHLMHEAMKPGVGAVGPFSNCDRGWLHDEEIVVDGVRLIPGMSIPDVEKVIPQIRDYAHDKRIVPRKWVAFYATLLSRAAIEKVGLLDEGFKSGDEDVDYCFRLRQAGYRILQTYDSFVFHFGGKTRKQVDTQSHEQHQREDAENHKYFIEKWKVHPGSGDFKNEMDEPRKASVLVSAPRTVPSGSDHRPIFGIYTGQAWEKWTPLSLDEGGIGGSETATIYTARAFAKRGFRSVVFGDCEGSEGIYDNVEYVHYPKFDEWIKKWRFHLFVSSRRADIFRLPILADKKAVIIHDIWLSQDPNAEMYSKAVDKFFVLSPWHRDFFIRHQNKADPGKVVISRDGIDLERFKAIYPRERGRMVYSSSPDRGLDVLLEVLPRIRKEVPEANVHVFYGFSNWEKAIRLRGRPGELEWMEAIKRRLDDPGVVYRGRVGQTQLAKEMLKAEVFAYPTGFTETFCMTAAEQMAAGNPVVTSDLAALSTTVGEAGILLQGANHSPEYKERFVREVVRMLTDRHRHRIFREKAVAKARAYSWDGIVDEWLGLVGLEAPKS